MDVLDILRPVSLLALPSRQMTVYDSNPGRVDLQEKEDCSFVTQRAFEASLDLLCDDWRFDPFMQFFLDEDESADADHVTRRRQSAA